MEVYQIPDKNGGYVVKLQLNGKVKVIGTVKDGVYTKTIDEYPHVMHKLDSIGFNKMLIERARNFSEIAVKMNGTVLRTTREKVLKEGQEQQYDKYETQLFLPIDQFN